MKGNAIYFLVAYHGAMRLLTDYLNSDDLYYFMDAVLIGIIGYYMFAHSDKSLPTKVALFCVFLLAGNQIVNTSLLMMGYESVTYIYFVFWVFVIADIFLIGRDWVERWMNGDV